MTPEEFAKKAQEIKDKYGSWDREAFHGYTDDLMEDLLIELGYEEGIKIIRSELRWYA